MFFFFFHTATFRHHLIPFCYDAGLGVISRNMKTNAEMTTHTAIKLEGQPDSIVSFFLCLLLPTYVPISLNQKNLRSPMIQPGGM